MKKIALLMAVGLALAAQSALGQGVVEFKNFGTDNVNSQSINAPIFDVDGTTKLAGTGFSVQLFYGASAGSLVNTGAPVQNFLTGGFAGLFGSPVVTLTGFATGTTPVLEVRAWNNQGGTVTSWASATIRGQSTSWTSAALGDSLTPSSIPTLRGLTSFSLVPEPTSMALGALGLAGLFFRRRK